MSFQDSAVIFFIALLLFGPKKLPELARQIGKLMGEFRRASNDFRMQMEDELRISEQAERQKQIAAIEAAAPASAAELPVATEALEPHPHEKLSGPAPVPDATMTLETDPPASSIPEHTIAPDTTPQPAERHYHHDGEVASPNAPLPIATSGDLAMMPPPSGLPIGRTNPSSVAQAFDSIPQAPSAPSPDPDPNSGTAHHG